MILCLLSFAFAGGIHAGIPVRGVPGVGEPTFLTPNTGWTAQVDGGFVRVFVGADEAAGEDWYGRTLQSLVVPAAPLDFPGADEAHGDGAALVAWRDGNVAVLVRVESGATTVAKRLHAAIVEAAPLSATPRLVADGTRWRIDATGAVDVRATGGRVVPFQPGVYEVPPREIVAWDAWGRPTVIAP